MPSAVASFDDAFDMDEPARKKAPRARAAPGKRPTARKRGGKKTPRFAFAVDGGRVVRLSAIALSGTLVVAILVNALLMQKGQHPAPLFGKSIALGASPVAKAAPAEPAAPVAAPEPAEMTPPAPISHGRTASAASTSSSDDMIGALIEGHAPPASAKADNKTVLGAQKALAKLGFTLKPSGTLGPQTRRAIEAFERDRHMPVKGELSHRVVKILAAESGVRID